MTMSRARKRILLGVSLAALLVIGGGSAVGIVLKNQAESDAANALAESDAAASEAAASFAKTTLDLPPRAPIQPTALAIGSVQGWSLAPSTDVAAVLPEVGPAADGSLSIGIDAPVVAKLTTVMATVVTVAPSTTYTLSAAFRFPSVMPTAIPGALRIGEQTVPIPDSNAAWTPTTTTYTTGPEETTLNVSVELGAPVRGLSVDDVSMVAADGVSVVQNGSFEQVDSEWGVRNASLILQQSSATLAVRLAEGGASWRATSADGATIVEGTATLGSGLSGIPLTGIGIGYSRVAITDAAGDSIEVPVVVVEMDVPYLSADMRLGTHLHAQKEYAADATPAAASVGMGIIRVGDSWQATEPRPGEYEFSQPFTYAFSQATALGMEKLMVVGRNNKAYDSNWTPQSAEALAAYGRYAAALAAHFDVAALEVFNEFNIVAFNRGRCGQTAECYLPLLKVAYENIKSVKPDLPVIGGVTGNFDRQFFIDLWNVGGLDYLDVVSFHPYQVYFEPDTLATVLAESRGDMAAAGGDKPIWITELGWTTKNTPGGVSEVGQAANLVRATTIALADGVERYFYYDLINDKVDLSDHEANFGLFEQRREGIAAYPPKPGAYAQALLANAVHDKAFVAREDLGNGAFAYVFGEGEDAVRIAWVGSGEQTVQLAAMGPVVVSSAGGGQTEIEPADGSISLTLTSTPVVVQTK